MKLWLVLAVLLQCSNTAHAADEAETVVTLTETNFDDYLANNPLVLVEFYAPWCGHCKALAPEYEKAAKVLIASEPSVILAKVDATQEKELGQRFGVSGYPTLKFFNNGEASDYDGPREADGIIEYIKKISDPNYEPPPEAVISIETDEQFHEQVMKEELALVEFYAPWCGHCKKLAPDYEGAAKKLQEISNPIPLYKVDATSESVKKSVKANSVSGYPTLKIYRDGKSVEYKGPLDANGIAQYMENQIGEASKPLQSFKQLQSMVKDSTDVLLLAVFDKLDSSQYTLYKDMCENIRDEYKMYYTDLTDVRQFLEIDESEPTLVIFRPSMFISSATREHTITTKIIKDDDDVTSLLLWITANNVALVGERTKENKQTRYSDKKPLCVLYVPVDWSLEYREMTNSWKHKLVPLAHRFETVTFALSDEDKFTDELNSLGLTDSGSDFSLACYEGLDKYPLSEDVDYWSEEEIEEFIQNFLDGKLKPYLKSAIPPKKQGPVYTVVGKTFDKIVRDPKKDVMIEIYAPWCGHCKKFEPIYRQLAKELAKEKTLLLAKIDGTANDTPSDFPSSGYPTIYFMPGGNQDPIRYDGDRTSEDVKTFLKKEAKLSFKSRDEL